MRVRKVQSNMDNTEAGTTQAVSLLQEPEVEQLDTSGWKCIPADDIGYINSAEFLTWPDDKALEFIRRFEMNRYGGPRNWKGLWRSTLGLDTTHGKRIMDYGCGFGIEALQFCRSGNEVVLSDIHRTNEEAAARVLRLSGYKRALLSDLGKVDVFYSNGCLHHTPAILEILHWAVHILSPEGEIRVLLYSDKAWTIKTSTPLPTIEADVMEAPAFLRFVRAMDDVGEYADWYNREKLEYRVGDFLTIERFDYIMENGMFCTATLRPK